MKKRISLSLALALLLSMALPTYAMQSYSAGVTCYSPADEGDFFFLFPLNHWTFSRDDDGYVLRDEGDALHLNSIFFVVSELPEGSDVMDSMKRLGLEYLLFTYTAMYQVNNDDPNIVFTTGSILEMNAYEWFYLEGSTIMDGVPVRLDLAFSATSRRFYSVTLLASETSYDAILPAFSSMLASFQPASEAAAPNGQATDSTVLPGDAGEASKNSAVSIPFIEKDGEPAPMVHTQIPETVLADTEAVRIVGKSISYLSTYSYEYVQLDLSIENKTDQRLTVMNDLLIVNGYDMMGVLCEEVDPGATVEAALTLDGDVLRWAEITTIADLSVIFSVISEDYSLLLDTPLAQLRTDAPEGFVQAVDDRGLCIWDGHGIRIIARFLEPRHISSSELVLLVENRTDSYAYLATETIQINGITVDLFGNEFLSPNSMAIASLMIDADVLNAQKIERIDSISLQYKISLYDQAHTKLVTDLMEIPVVH